MYKLRSLSGREKRVDTGPSSVGDRGSLLEAHETYATRGIDDAREISKPL